ncbi:MAG: allantoicase [Bacteroidetes bacterium]|nr:MAG: allantoicase [Bacteroidota bacterium]REK04732.1 MAG: allantoicase [Bacteroidota bacterium]REK36206.1 MAG: allantoicase [Bacteroidota bacterium]REK51423.1 MAG: allantoicase [Bacteroidota bacterium]
MTETVKESPAYTSKLNLAAEKLGARALACSDDFFAEMENLVKPGRGIFIADKYTDRGKWMDGWESRRKRVPGHDWCILKLGAPGRIHGFDIDTNHFLGNHPPFASIEAVNLEGDPDVKTLTSSEIKWTEILAKSPLNPGSQNFYPCSSENVYTHLRLNIYPDGGVARLKVYGEVFKDWSKVKNDEVIDLASALNGAKAVLCNDMFFSHMDNLLMPGRGVNMGDGWETKRNRTPGNRDWVIIRLGHKGRIQKILVDTCHFKGNYPDTCSIEGTLVNNDNAFNPDDPSIKWFPILDRQKLQADHEHYFENEIMKHDALSHVRLNIFPDGGVSRLRLWGNKV